MNILIQFTQIQFDIIINSTTQKMKFSITDLFSKCDQIRCFFGFGHIYWRNPYWKTSFCCAVKDFPNIVEEYLGPC